MSSIGIGTYKGSLNEEDDLLMFNGIVDSLIDGVNLVDCCRNFRGGRSEIVIGKALQYLIEKEKYSREEYLIASKLGYVR